MKELIEMLAKSLVDEPENVDVRAVENNEELMLELRVAPDDVGKVIGRQGRTIKAMRTLVHAAAIRTQRRAQLEIIED
jgi:predicted RNA-binding protein YlqC (UPF0109 family)